jgi:hypothetical protein
MEGMGMIPVFITYNKESQQISIETKQDVVPA